MTLFKEHTICCNYTVHIEQSVNAHVRVKPTSSIGWHPGLIFLQTSGLILGLQKNEARGLQKNEARVPTLG